MRLSDFDYPLPKEKIALFPSGERAAARLLCIDRKTGASTHRIFRDLPGMLKPTDLLVLNNTRVLPARLFGKRVTGGKVEALLLKEAGANVWECLLKPGGRVKDGERIVFFDHPNETRSSVSKTGSQKGGVLEGTAIPSAVVHSGKRRIRFKGEGVKEKIKKLGHIPLPPYIDRPDVNADRETYQTVFAEKEGAVAAPTAGLHFDEPLLEKIRARGVEIVPITLHVSYGTFQPITVENIEDHKMFEEEYEITEDASAKINRAKRDGRRIVVCGTTCVRALESAVLGTGSFSQKRCLSPLAKKGQSLNIGTVPVGKAKTSIFIHPPYEFKIVDALITNFHMPRSTLLVMLAAFLGYEKTMNAYRIALKENYRFASYGDAMLIS